MPRRLRRADRRLWQGRTPSGHRQVGGVRRSTRAIEDAATGDEAPPVRARGLVKRYDDVLAVDHIDLNVNAGDVYGFLGPNGAGKTTTLRMALGLITPSEGKVELFGRDPMRAGARGLEGGAGVG